jgi:hypothetical protein
MKHNLKLNDAAATTLHRALDDIDSALNGLRRLTTMTDEQRAWAGTIGEAAWRIDQLVFNTDPDDSEYGLPAPVAHCPVCDQDTTLPLGCDVCEPHGIERPDVEADALTAILDAEDAIVARKASAVTADDMLNLLDEGVIDMREFHNELDRRGIDQSHLCIEPGCDQRVQFDDEPRCFTHSPDEGSSVRGYSHLMYARRARQTADSCGENFIM